MVLVRHAASLEDADAYITSVAFPSSSPSTTSEASDQPIFMMTTAEDDVCRLYDLNTVITKQTQQQQQQQPHQASSFSSTTNLNSILQHQKIFSNNSLLRAAYSFPEIGAHKCIFTEGNGSCLLAPRNRSDSHQIYGLDLETGSLVASYLIHEQSQNNTSVISKIPQQHTTPWFSSLVLHPTASGVFAASGENSNVFFCHAGVSSPIARLSSMCVGRSVVEFSPNGNLVAVGDRDYLNIYDWRKFGSNEGPVTQFKVRELLHASRWLSDVGSITGLQFHPNSSNDEFDARKLLVTTSRYVVRTIDHTINVQQSSTSSSSSSEKKKPNVVLQTFGASGAAASHLPNERPSYFANKRMIPTAARFSPLDGRFVSCGTCMGRVTVFDARMSSTRSGSASSVKKEDQNDDEPKDMKPLTPENSAASAKKEDDGNNTDEIPHETATLTNVLFGRHHGAVSVAEWCPGVPALVSTCRSANVWRLN